MKSTSHVEQPIRVAVIGQAGVGKSALVVRYLTRRFIWEYDPTLECVYKHQACIDGKSVNVEILDTGAAFEQNDSYSADIDGHLGWADGILLVYSVTDRSSFELVAALANRLRSSFDSDSDDSTFDDSSIDTFSCRRHSVVIVGNKSDLAMERRVERTDGAGLADCSLEIPNNNNNNNSPVLCVPATNTCFVEASARDGGPEIAAAFDGLCRQVLARRCLQRSAPPSGERSPKLFRGASSQSLAIGDTNKRGFARRLVVLQAVNRLVKMLHS